MIEQIKEKILAIIENHRKLQNNVKSFNPDLAMGLQALIDEDNYILSAINSIPKDSANDVWHDGKNRPPFAGKEIIVRRGGKNYYGKYIGGARRFVCAEIRLTDDTAETYAIINYMSDDDKWAYLDDLLTFIPSEAKIKVEHKCDCKHVGCHINDCRRWCHSMNKEVDYALCNPNCADYIKDEKPDLDLEKEIETQIQELMYSSEYTKRYFRKIARHFANWQKEHLKCPCDCPSYKDGYKVGAKETKRQILEKACEWLKAALICDAYCYPYGGVDYETLITDFLKVMED